MRSILYIGFLLFFLSCGKSTEQETADTIDVALSYLTDGKCEDAIEVLEDLGRKNGDAVYLQVLASAYACRANFNEVRFISTDIPAIVTTSGQALMRSLSILTLSDEDAADSSDYLDVKTAMGVLAYATGATTPGQAERTTAFGVRGAGDIGVQLLFLSIVELGKFLNYYGNVNAAGAKGLGGGASTCFIDYSDPRAQAVIAANSGGACNSNTGGHPDLDFAAANLTKAKRRLCEGLVAFNTIVDVVANLDLSGTESLSKFTSVNTTITALRAPAVAAGLGPLLALTSQSECETAMGDNAKFADMEFLYSMLFESGLQ